MAMKNRILKNIKEAYHDKHKLLLLDDLNDEQNVDIVIMEMYFRCRVWSD